MAYPPSPSEASAMARKAYPSDVSDDEWALVAPYLTLMTEDAPQREHSLREVFNGLRWIVRVGAAWRMTEAIESGIAELARFARGLQEDLAAVKAGLTLEWSNGVTEGQIHRLKLVKRQGSGQTGFALLRQRLLPVA